MTNGRSQTAMRRYRKGLISVSAGSQIDKIEISEIHLVFILIPLWFRWAATRVLLYRSGIREISAK